MKQKMLSRGSVSQSLDEARARRGTGNESKRKRARADGCQPAQRHAAEPPGSGRSSIPASRQKPRSDQNEPVVLVAKTPAQQAGKLKLVGGSASDYVSLLDALNSHRGKGQQKVTVEHVHVHSGGQAIVGTVSTPGGGDASKSEEQAHAKQIGHAPQPPLWSANPQREALPVTSDGEP
jgi:hypothetical protein